MRPFIPLILVTAIANTASHQVLAAEPPTARTQSFFHAEKVKDRWWLIAPDGHRFISKGVTTVQFAQDTIQGTSASPYGAANTAKYGTREAWQKATARRLLGWGFNTLGAWSDEALSEIVLNNQRLAYAPTLDLGATFVGQKQKAQAWLHGIFPDVLDPDFEVIARQRARELCTPPSQNHWLLGWFTD